MSRVSASAAAHASAASAATSSLATATASSAAATFTSTTASAAAHAAVVEPRLAATVASAQPTTLARAYRYIPGARRTPPPPAVAPASG